MKKKWLLAIVIIAFSAPNLCAQLGRGNVMIGSDITNLKLDLGSSNAFSFTLNPKAAWFIEDNMAVGGYLTFGISTAKASNTHTTYGTGALGRYYFDKHQVPLTHQSRFFVEANTGIEGSSDSQGSSTNGLGIGFGPGIAYFVTQNIGLEALLKYNGIIGFGSSVTSNQLSLNIGFQIYLPSARLKQVKDEATHQ